MEEEKYTVQNLDTLAAKAGRRLNIHQARQPLSVKIQRLMALKEYTLLLEQQLEDEAKDNMMRAEVEREWENARRDARINRILFQ